MDYKKAYEKLAAAARKVLRTGQGVPREHEELAAVLAEYGPSRKHIDEFYKQLHKLNFVANNERLTFCNMVGYCFLKPSGVCASPAWMYYLEDEGEPRGLDVEYSEDGRSGFRRTFPFEFTGDMNKDIDEYKRCLSVIAEHVEEIKAGTYEATTL